MTVKMAVADCRARRRQGGARGAGAADRRGAPRAAAPLRASSSPSLGGTYRTAGDMNITPADLDVVAETCPWVYGTTGARRQQRPRHGARRAARDPRERRARLRLARPRGPHACSCRAPASVGHDLARDLRAEGARVLVSDVDEDARGARPAPTVVAAPATRSTTECDVYSPCAVGGTLSAETIPRLRCRIVAGSANNQLAEPEDAERLHARRDPLRARLRDQRRRRHPARRARGPRLGRGRARAQPRRRSATRCAHLSRRRRGGVTPAAAAERLAAERIAQKRDEALA